MKTPSHAATLSKGKSPIKKDQSDRQKKSISLESFGQRKGQVRALEEFRVRQQRKRLATAKALRKYRKVMKGEGFEAGTGASRKRKEVDGGDEDNEVEEEPIEDDEEDQEDSTTRSSEEDKPAAARRTKSNPFQKSLAQSEKKRLALAQAQKDREQNEKDRKKKLRERRVRTKNLAKRTQRGQPIMKYTVQNMLHQLERQQQQHT
eukprot:Nitzschia sp. Nitz4//scaffold54_size114964//97586//98200//NITZ4_003867-RA/size114964-processed-gene-0.193-mRNA-1//-1//CDS//3329554399//1378//frame0